MFFLFNWQRIRNIPISKKLYFIVGTMAVLIAVELFTLWFAIGTLSAVRAAVGAEGLYTKAQKDGLYQLEKYGRTHDERDYTAFLRFMEVPMGIHRSRVELTKPHPDMRVVRQGFREGRIHEDDIDGIIDLLQRFGSIHYIRQAQLMWARGDTFTAQIRPIGERIHAVMGNASQEELNRIISGLDPINRQLTALGEQFSATLGAGSRWLEHMVLRILFIMALTVEITGLALTMTVSQSIKKGLKEIRRAALRIAGGDLTDRARVYAADEIGQVAVAMNTMTGQLVRSNTELSHFAYIASHDLQEPLRTITIYSGLLQQKAAGQLDAATGRYLQSIMTAAARMQSLIRDVLEYSRIGHEKVRQPVDTKLVLREVLQELSGAIVAAGAQVSYSPLPVIDAYPEFRSLLLHLIGNAVKFRRPEVAPAVRVEAEERPGEWEFRVRDNGIGIEAGYHERIFTIFQKLHSHQAYEGTGIGLAHCKKIVELHGGRIWVASIPGAGSTFHFTVPK